MHMYIITNDIHYDIHLATVTVVYRNIDLVDLNVPDEMCKLKTWYLE